MKKMSPRAHWIAAATVLAIMSALCVVPAWCQEEGAVSGQVSPTAAPATGKPDASEAPNAADAPDAATIPTKNLLQALREGGLLMVPIAACSFVLCVFVFERAISLRRGRVIPAPFVKRFIEQLRENELTRDEALERCDENGSCVSDVFAAAVRKWGRPSVEVEQAIIDAGERVTHTLRRYLRLLNGISTISPLLGLLGTVLGMISAFNAIATGDAMGRPEMLASGISQALLTTAAGMSVAIPALIAYLFFTSRVDKLIIEMDRLGQQVVEQIASDGVRAERKRKKAA